MIISMIIRTKGIGLKAQYILIARRKRKIGLDAKQPGKCELSDNSIKYKTGISLGLKLKPIVSNI